MKKEKIVLVGAGQHFNVVLFNIIAQQLYDVACLLDVDEAKWGTKLNGVFVEPGYSDFDVDFLKKIQQKYQTNKFFISLGSMRLRKPLFEFFRNNGWESVNVIHPNAVVSKWAKLGKGILIECGCLVTPQPIIRDNVVVNTGSQINHDNVIEDHVYIASGVILSGGVTIKQNTLLDDGVIVTLGQSVGSNCIIGAGAVVTKHIEDNSIAYGSPCKVIKPNNKF